MVLWIYRIRLEDNLKFEPWAPIESISKGFAPLSFRIWQYPFRGFVRSRGLLIPSPSTTTLTYIFPRRRSGPRPRGDIRITRRSGLAWALSQRASQTAGPSTGREPAVLLKSLLTWDSIFEPLTEHGNSLIQVRYRLLPCLVTCAPATTWHISVVRAHHVFTPVLVCSIWLAYVLL
jgi:hypothetical protein